mgnify:CR=1 FL=1
MLNKKRGYKSSRKAKTTEEGDAIDGMKIAKEIFENNLTPGQWVYNSLSKGGKFIPDFYRSDLKKEIERIVRFQNQFHLEQIKKICIDYNWKNKKSDEEKLIFFEKRKHIIFFAKVRKQSATTKFYRFIKSYNFVKKDKIALESINL